VEQGYWFFKLSNTIKEEHEVDFAELELVSLFGKVQRVRNFADVLYTTPLKHFTGEDVRIQDVLMYEPCYGYIQGFMGTSTEIVPNISRLVRRLAYVREFYAIMEAVDPQSFLMRHFPEGELGKNVIYYSAAGYTLFRFVTNQYYLEKSHYVSKVSRNEEEIRRNVQTLIEYPLKELYRIPASATMSVGKRLQDYFTIREELSLYLTHMLHPYKGKFHARMVRALLNYVLPDDSGLVMDNFAGSGTLLLEATLMGVNSVGVEINPLSVLMSNVKCQCLSLDPSKLKAEVARFVREVKTALAEYQTINSGGSLLVQPMYDPERVAKRRASIPREVREMFKSDETLAEIIIAHELLGKLGFEDKIRDFMLLALSGTISDLARRTSADFIEVLSARISWMYLRVFLFHELNRHLRINVGRSETYLGDTRDFRTCRNSEGSFVHIDDNSIDAIVTSPPYSTALDYIRNDLPQLTILRLVESMEELENNMMGNPDLRVYPDELLQQIQQGHENFQRLPQYAKSVIHELLNAGRKREAMRTYKFFHDMYLTLKEMFRVLKPGGKAVIIIGNNHYKLDGGNMEVKNDEVIAEMGQSMGFRKHLAIVRDIEKTMTGMIRYETVLILEKPSSPSG